MDGCGNSFLIVDEMQTPIVGADRSTVANALATQHDTDGILYLDKIQGNYTMRIFDRDGSEETMCGNGLRCATRYFFDRYIGNPEFSVITCDGEKEVKVIDDLIEVNLGFARDYQKLASNVHYVFIGVPHIVIVSGAIDVDTARGFGQYVRNDPALCHYVGQSGGVNVNFIWRSKEGISVITYEVGVEDVTNSCGTGSAASAYVAAKVFGTHLPLATESPGGRLEILVNNGKLSIRGSTKYHGKVLGFVSETHPKPVMPVSMLFARYMLARTEN